MRQCDAVDDADDRGDLLAAGVDVLHGRHQPLHRLPALVGKCASALRQLVGVLRMLRVVHDGAAELVHRARRFFQRGRLLLGAARKIVIALCDLP
jgi:hypothetical protein